MSKKYATLLVILLCSSLYSQLRFLDTEERVIHDVKLLNEKGDFVFSDRHGVISKNKVTQIISGLALTDSLEIFSPSYNREKVCVKDLVEGKKEVVLFFNEHLVNLEDLVVVAKEKNILVLEAYFNTYQIVDSEAESFSDGLVAIYIDKEKNKFLKYNIIASRVFKKEKRKTETNNTFNVGSNLLPFYFPDEILLKEGKRLTKNKRATIVKRANSAEISIDYVLPEDYKSIGILGLKTDVLDENVTEKFSSPVFSLKSLQSISRSYHSLIKRKESQYDYKLMQNIYISKRRHINKKTYKNLKKDFNSANEKSKNVEQLIAPQHLPHEIEKTLYKKLKMINSREE